MKKRELTKIQKRFVLIKLISIWLPIICWFVTSYSLNVEIHRIFMLCTLGVSIALCTVYLFNYRKTDGRILAILITLVFCIMFFANYFITKI